MILDIYPGARPGCTARTPRLAYPDPHSPYLWAARGYAYARIAAPRDLIRTEAGPITGLPDMVGAARQAILAAGLADPDAFASHLAPLRKASWVVYAKPPFGGPEAVPAYLSRYTHRVAISNHRLVSADAETVAFRWKDYRIKSGNRQKVIPLTLREPCPCCGSPMRIIEIFRRGQIPMSRAPPREQAA